MKNDSISNLTIQMLTNSNFLPEKPPRSCIQALTSDTLMYEETPYTLEAIFDKLETFEPSQVAYIGMKRHHNDIQKAIYTAIGIDINIHEGNMGNSTPMLAISCIKNQIHRAREGIYDNFKDFSKRNTRAFLFRN